VGAVVVKNGKVRSTAHRGEAAGNHAEFIALEKKLPDEAVAGATVYTTLEPCASRNPPKIACADRLVGRKVIRVVVGMLDPHKSVRGLGLQKLRSAGIHLGWFDPDMMAECEEMNRDFIRSCEESNNRTES
jgi:pyrimidine deaminase RibD-like protein